MAGVGGKQRVEVDVGDTVAIGQAEPAALQRPGRAVQPAAGGCLLAGGQAADLGVGGPRLGADEPRHLLAPVAGEQQEPAKALRQEDLQDVPHDRTSPDLHHRLGDRLGVLLQPGAPAPAEDHHAGSRAHGGGLSGIITGACPS
jgi:hypothetical protein